jgi:hypothetical protein
MCGAGAQPGHDSPPGEGMRDHAHTHESPQVTRNGPTRRELLGAAASALALAACSSPGKAEPVPQMDASAPARAGMRATTPSGTPAATATTVTAPAPTPRRPELPRGGRSVFPTYRLAGFCGHPGSPALGKLGIGDLEARVSEIEHVAGSYARDRAALPVLELIATMVQSKPGADGLYRLRTESSVIDQHLQAARQHRAYLLLNIQPGRASFLDEVHAYERWLTQPDVGVALDPEWAVGPGQVPGKVYGHVDTSMLNEVGEYVAGLVASHDLPEKVVAYHQLTPSIVRREQDLKAFPGVGWVKSVDGIGAKVDKIETWNRIIATTPRPLVHVGFKLFYDEDSKQGLLMTPDEVLALTPQPEYVMYE